MRRIFRYPLVVRLTHWLTALALLILTMSGMQIFNAHPALYASDASNFNQPVLAIRGGQDAHGQPVGYVQLGNGVRLNTTHVLGWGPDGHGKRNSARVPGLGDYSGATGLGRRPPLAFALRVGLNRVCAVVRAFGFQALAYQSRFPGAAENAARASTALESAPWRPLNPLQKLTYFGVVFVVTPIVILSGMALSPTIDSWFHWLPAMFGGRQFARIWHFAGMWALILFFVGHVAMVALTGLINNVRSMISGWFVIPTPTTPPSPVEPVPVESAPA